MTADKQVKPFDYVVFGATGDLTMRKLLPAFYYRLLSGEVPDSARIIGTARSPLDRATYQGRARDALKRFVAPADFKEAQVERFLNMVYYVSLDGSKADSNWEGLSGLLSEGPQDHVRVFYFATAPNLYEAVSANLHAKGLVTDDARVVLEKPIGTDLATADEINTGVGKFFKENNIFRIDHYLGKETVQDVIALRFANPLLSAVWSGDYIKSVQITAAETVGVEGRAAYYDTSGALRDMVQNHLLQVLCLVAMEPPASLEADAVRDAKVAVLKSLRPLAGDRLTSDTVRGQYVAGEINEENVRGYLEELGHASNTETYVALRAEVDTPRWKNVPFYIRTAKRLHRKVSEIVITFKPAETNLFPQAPKANVLVIRVQPDEGLTWHLSVKDPQDDSFELRDATMDTHFGPQFKVRYPDAYERLLLDAVRGYPVLFIRRDEVEAAWRWVAPIMEAWANGTVPMSQYAAGSWGPEEATAMLAEHGDTWHEAIHRQ
ncbi:glucose-6-phosphate 1-dehydrogenase [Neoasaia chiangmaiensis NBRC 101099]|uniref:Glucose-6-phosphate 1-dehydrogenase n=1 Tax=Neoasaia chiangmaiensis TaxID=320497 RepID=A0A1U9KM60_9PROT|nr:glucose-6-phosphate dehydrogenase [Neoasaia chiangmaiensis]AQS86820.1 glucose-6-phosphate dehydrogenase [Neoasaia chiangmaiensis]GBR37298.1 glucose-6-phosphate 1-dehydrogenase [Neoasaia chiangmaiensis NBRC 101099]GEN14886.1 glucose-6-phosphate 1-dehydrogenase [Neoasaia chiangmaiensis]